jgi:hypothetical protein
MRNANQNQHLQGDHVRYVGGKSFSGKDGAIVSLQGAIGEVVGRVQNTDHLIVDFKGTSYRIAPDNLVHQVWNDSEEKHIRALDRKWKTTDDKKRGKNSKPQGE